jgi:uncharacterized protein with von Willebrand factor type A (vWA) domain
MDLNHNEIGPGKLLRNCVLFGRLLRSVGVEVTPTQMVDLVDSLQHVDIGSRRDFKYSARAVLVNRREHLELFDQAFDLFWQARDQDELASLDLGLFIRKQEQPQQEIVQTITPADKANGQEPPSDETQMDRTFTYSNVELLRQKDFAKLTEHELAQLKQLMLKTEWNLAERRTRRTERAARGDYVDLRNTFRQNLRHGGEPLRLQRRNRRHKKRPFVVICDISGSMERYSRVLLQFIYAITTELDRVEAFVFSTRLTRITRQLKRRDVDSALDEAATVIHDWAGGTRIGESIKSFNYEWARRVLGQGAIVLLISDGWDRGDVALLSREMDRLHRSCHQLIWLNPLLGAANYEPLVRGIQAALPHIDHFMPVHNLASLEQLAQLLESGFA